MRFRIACAVVAIALASCSGDDPTLPVREGGSVQEPRERASTAPEGAGPRLVIQARGRAGDFMRRGAADLRQIGFWGPLTRHLYVVELDSRLGEANVPDDRHLADAFYTGVIDDRGAGGLCDIMFFPTAVSDDLARWRGYHAQGRIEEEPPSLRRFWVSLLAHELAHCGLHRQGEAYARRWEQRTRAELAQESGA